MTSLLTAQAISKHTYSNETGFPIHEDESQNRQRQTVGVVALIAQQFEFDPVLRAYEGMPVMADTETIELSGQCCTQAKEFNTVGSMFDVDVSVPATTGGDAVPYASCRDVLPENTASVAGFSNDGPLLIVACERLGQALVASNCTLADLRDADMMQLVETLEGRWLAREIATRLAEPVLKRSMRVQTTSERLS